MLFLGNVARWFGLLSLISCVPALIAFPLGLVIHSICERDLRKMHAGMMDPEGRPQTLAASSAAAQGAARSVAAAMILMCVVALLSILK